MHKVLDRQLRRLDQVYDQLPHSLEEWKALLDRISSTYEDSDRSRYLLERAISISSSEMQELYRNLKRRSRDELLAERDKLRSVMTALDDSLCAYSFDEGLLFTNPAASVCFSRRQVPTTVTELFTALKIALDSDNPQANNILQALFNGEVVRDIRAVIDGDCESKIPVRCVFTPLVEQKTIYGFVLLFHDISDELEFESQQRLATSVFESNEAIAITDSVGNVLKVNNAFLKTSGYKRSEVVGKNARLFRVPGQLQKFSELTRTLGTDGFWEGEILFKCRDGHTVPLWLSTTAVLDTNNLTSHIVAHFTDISVLKQLEEAQHEAMEKAIAGDRAKTEFLAVISHEVRTPLNTMLGVNDLLEKTILSDEQKKLLRLQKSSSQHLLQLIDDILEYISHSRPSDRLQTATFNCRETIDSIIEMMTGRVNHENLSLFVEYDDDIPAELIGHPRYLRQVLINLIGNSIKFTPSGTIKVSVKYTRYGQLICTVEDTGIGIAVKNQQKIFEPFTQVDSSLNRQYTGLGLGLSISKKLVDEINGQLWLDEEYRDGCRFSLALSCRQVSQDESKAASPVEAITPDQDGTFEGHILLAEDNADNQSLFALFIEGTGYEVEVVSNGIEAVRQFHLHRPAIILMDIQMPLMDGYQAVEKIRQIERVENLPRTVIIALTAHASEDHRQQSLAAGCDDHLSKPFKRETLLAKIHQYTNLAMHA